MFSRPRAAGPPRCRSGFSSSTLNQDRRRRHQVLEMLDDAPREARWVRSEPRERFRPKRRNAWCAGLSPEPHPARPTARRRPAQRELQADAGPPDRTDRPPGLRAPRLVVPQGSRPNALLDAFVPVPRVLLAEPAREGLRVFMLQRYVEGPTFLELVGTARPEEVAEAARSAGDTLAEIGSVTFAGPGWLAPGPTVAGPLLPGADPMPRFVQQCLASSMARNPTPPALIDKTRAVMWSHATELHRAADETSLVHGDFAGPNLIVRQVAACWAWRRFSTEVRCFRLSARRRPALPSVQGTRTAGYRAAFSSALSVWRAVPRCRRSGAASRDSSISSRSATC